MAKNKTYTVKYKRKRQLKTDYRKRLKLLTSERTRLVVRTSLNRVLIQAVDFHEKGDKIIGSLNSSKLKEFGWNISAGNIPSAYLTGFLFAKQFKSKVKNPVIDLGIKTVTSRSRISAVIKGLHDGGLKINFNEKISPTNEDIQGKTIADYAKKLEKDQNKYKKQFSVYLKNNIKPESLPEMFKNTKTKIEEKWKSN